MLLACSIFSFNQTKLTVKKEKRFVNGIYDDSPFSNPDD